MAKVRKKPAKRKSMVRLEAEPDAWERFEKAVHKIAPPKKAKTKTAIADK